MSKGPLSRFAFFWQEQRGRCALMITDACRLHGGQMTTDRMKAGHQRPSHATWDHIYPKPRTPEQEPIQVLACAACNNKRGNAPARAEYVARGLVLCEEWRALEAKRAGVIGVKKDRRRVKYEQRRVVRGHQWAEREAKRAADLKAMQAEVDAPAPVDRTKHPYVPRTGYGESMSARVKREQRNAESQAAALKGIAERMTAQGDKHGANMITAKAANILAAVRGKPPERK